MTSALLRGRLVGLNLSRPRPRRWKCQWCLRSHCRRMLSRCKGRRWPAVFSSWRSPCWIKNKVNICHITEGNLTSKQQNVQQYLQRRCVRNVSVTQVGGSRRFLALSASVCRMGLASALKCASEQTESCK